MRLTKHHGLGNDFAIHVDLDATSTIDADVARRVCDRHRGLGADGLIWVTRGVDARFRMHLWNEDGSRAELSGNGISCLAQALVHAGYVGSAVDVETDAGLRRIDVVDRDGPRHHRMRVALGDPVVGDEVPEWESDAVLRAVTVDVGNPHLVCHVADRSQWPDLVALGEAANAAFPAGVNVELITPGPGDDELTMSVYERGVGPTQACGTGAVASATAAHHLGLAGTTVQVTQPGGTATVEVGSPAHLTVPVELVAEVRWLA